MSRLSSVERGHRSHRLSVLANAGLTALKLAVGWISGSQAVLADGAHSAGDVLLSLAAWIGFRWSRVPADEDHHYGHGNGEALAGLLVGLILVVAGGGLLWGAFAWDRRTAHGALGAAAVAVVVVTMVAKLALARTVGRAAAALNSQSLAAVARDHRADVYASVLVLVGVLASLAGLEVAEPIATFIVGCLVVRMGWTSVREGFDTLMDRVPDTELRDRIGATAGAVAGVRGVRNVRVHPLGSEHEIALEVLVDRALTVEQGHSIAHRVVDAVVADHEHIRGVHVHVGPAGAD